MSLEKKDTYDCVPRWTITACNWRHRSIFVSEEKAANLIKINYLDVEYAYMYMFVKYM